MSAFRISLSMLALMGAMHLLAVVLPAWAQTPPEVGDLLTEAEQLLASHPPDVDRARDLIDRALDRAPDHPHANAMDVWRRYAHNGSFMSALRHERQLRSAKKLIEADSTNAVAHLVVGALQLDQYRNQKDRVSIPVQYSDGNVMDIVMGYLDPRREDGRDLGIVRDINTERAYSSDARTHLEMAFRNLDGPFNQLAGKRLAELALLLDDAPLGLRVARRLQLLDGSKSLGHELEALFQVQSGRPVQAWAAAETVLKLLDPSERAEWLDRAPVKRPSRVLLEGDWLDDDPRWETPENERLAEHVARRVALRLLGYPPESDPGRLIVRYGLPSERVLFSSDRDAFMAMSYPFSTFLFHDMAKTKDWIFWSSSAADLTGPRNVIRQWQRDQTIHAAEQFERTPARSGVRPTERIPLHAAIYGFGPHEARDWVVGWCPTAEGAHDFESVTYVALHAAASGSSDAGFRPVPEPGPEPVKLAEWTGDRARSGAVPMEGISTASCRPVFHLVETGADYGRFSLEVRDRQGRAGAVRMRTAPAPGEGPVMSDLVLSRLVAEAEEPDATVPDGYFQRGNRLIEPLLPRVTGQGESVAVYFEVHDLHPSADRQNTVANPIARTVEITAVLSPVEQRDRTTVSVSFVEEVRDRTWARDFILDLDGVKLGAYHLMVRVTDISGNLPVLERSTTLEVQSP